ncbi:beta-galactosidase [Dyadobacter bucti]|uniref:beta-galactosidase n=1 Tax=Dyadobacter bucti TaxID=2572203 RepID=UPI003F6FBB97
MHPFHSFKNLLAGFLLLSGVCCFSQNTLHQIDLRDTSSAQLEKLDFSGISPDGTSLAVNNKYFERNGKPWYPIMGEFHYSRYPNQFWEEEIVKMKSAGISAVATYIFWNVHEQQKGTWDWTGNLDLRRFIGLCQKHKMYVWIRIGPFDNAELRNGGLPDWIQDLKGRRSNDPIYLAESLELYRQIAQQTKGLYFKDGGPIIGAQLENEFAHGDQAHIGELKKMALKAGITPVYFTITANTVFRDDLREAIPLQGAYPYRGWEAAGGGATKDFLYGNDQWILTDALGKVYYDVNKYPKGLCEQGCGSQMTYLNRFTVDPAVVEAHLQNQIGRGMNLIGYYMFIGSTQVPAFKKDDCPVSYDFQAPVTEFGLIRPSYRNLKILHNFLADFGSDLAEMKVTEPENPVREEKNTKDLRYIARSSAKGGFVFLGNTQVRVTMPDKNVRLRLTLPDETIAFPDVMLKGQQNAIFPFNLNVNGALLKYATAQPLARLKDHGNESLFLTEITGTEVALAFSAKTVSSIVAKGWTQRRADGMICLTPQKGRQEITIVSKEGKLSTILLLTRQQAENSWRSSIDGKPVMIISEADLMLEGDQIEFRQLDNPLFSFAIYPSSASIGVNQAVKKVGSFGKWMRYAISLPAANLAVKTDHFNASQATVQLPSSMPAHVSDIVLRIDYRGGMAEATSNDQILTDHLFHGPEWNFGLKRYMQNPAMKSIDFKALPWDKNITGVEANLVREIQNQNAQIKSITAIPQYAYKLKLN